MNPCVRGHSNLSDQVWLGCHLRMSAGKKKILSVEFKVGSGSGVPWNLVGGEGGSTNSVYDRGQRERGSGGGSPLVRGSGGSCNLVQEI
jgi:hypothetical protein